MADPTRAATYSVKTTGTTYTVPNVVVAAGQSLVAFMLYAPASGSTVTSIKWNTTETFTVPAGLARSATLQSPTPGTFSVVATLSSSPAGGGHLVVLVLDNFSAVGAVGTGATTVITQTLTTAVGDYCCAGLTESFGDTNDLAPISGCTSQYSDMTGTTGSAAIDGFVVDRSATSTSTTFGWSVVTQDSNRARKSEYMVLQGTAVTADTIAKNAGDNQAAQAGTAVGTPLSVLVTDSTAGGAAVPGYSVTFVVASGGGSLGSSGTVSTNASGIATCPSWTLGATAGVNTITVTDAALSGSPLTFTAFGTSGAIGGGTGSLINGGLMSARQA